MQDKNEKKINTFAKMDENIIEISQRIAKIRFVFCQNNNVLFAQKLGKNPTLTSQICNGSKTPGNKFLQQILKTFPNVSKSWLFFGDEPMLMDNHGNIIGNTAGGDIIGNGAVKTSPDIDVKELITVILSQQRTIENLSNKLK